ncbi:unnamed protein product [Protopolystoma xenopodis]|uniref:Uncharacterized protein n=1 Tax=Protopolystoma xenopodis TaxID=117903 RepID=A0A448X8L6_9PLAT|nr:unnamed protein product [Protopolystoma xenopodis]
MHLCNGNNAEESIVTKGMSESQGLVQTKLCRTHSAAPPCGCSWPSAKPSGLLPRGSLRVSGSVGTSPQNSPAWTDRSRVESVEMRAKRRRVPFQCKRTPPIHHLVRQ